MLHAYAAASSPLHIQRASPVQRNDCATADAATAAAFAGLCVASSRCLLVAAAAAPASSGCAAVAVAAATSVVSFGSCAALSVAVAVASDLGCGAALCTVAFATAFDSGAALGAAAAAVDLRQHQQAAADRRLHRPRQMLIADLRQPVRRVCLQQQPLQWNLQFSKKRESCLRMKRNSTLCQQTSGACYAGIVWRQCFQRVRSSSRSSEELPHYRISNQTSMSVKHVCHVASHSQAEVERGHPAHALPEATGPDLGRNEHV